MRRGQETSRLEACQSSISSSKLGITSSKRNTLNNPRTIDPRPAYQVQQQLPFTRRDQFADVLTQQNTLSRIPGRSPLKIQYLEQNSSRC